MCERLPSKHHKLPARNNTRGSSVEMQLPQLAMLLQPNFAPFNAIWTCKPAVPHIASLSLCGCSRCQANNCSDNGTSELVKGSCACGPPDCDREVMLQPSSMHLVEEYWLPTCSSLHDATRSKDWKALRSLEDQYVTMFTYRASCKISMCVCVSASSHRSQASVKVSPVSDDLPVVGHESSGHRRRGSMVHAKNN
eukprot:4221401-Amphidinium_carterae.1